MAMNSLSYTDLACALDERAWLEWAIGQCSCDKIAPKPSPEASVSNTNGIWKSRLNPVHAKSPTTVFFLDQKHQTREWANARLNYTCCQHFLDQSFNLPLLGTWVSIWPDIDGIRSGFQLDTVVNVTAKRESRRHLEDIPYLANNLSKSWARGGDNSTNDSPTPRPCKPSCFSSIRKPWSSSCQVFVRIFKETSIRASARSPFNVTFVPFIVNVMLRFF